MAQTSRIKFSNTYPFKRLKNTYPLKRLKNKYIFFKGTHKFFILTIIFVVVGSDPEQWRRVLSTS